MKTLKKIGQVAIIVLVGYFIIRLLVKNWQEVHRSISGINYGLLVVSFFIMAIGFVWQVYLWRRIVSQYGIKIPFIKGWNYYLKAAIVRYIPGNIWGLAAKAYMMTKVGLNKAEAVFVMIFESAMMVTSGLFIYFISVSFLDSSLVINIILAVLAVLMGTFVFYPPWYIRFLRIFRRDIVIRTLQPTKVIALIIGYFIYWIICGLSFILLLKSIGDFSWSSLHIAVGVFAISWVIGFMSLITPSGIGVREVSMIYFLGKVMTTAVTAVATVLARIVFTGGELLSFFLAVMFKYFTRDKNQQ